jgi:glyoxylate carboligase
MSKTVSEFLVGVLEQIGVTQIFGLIGDSLNPLADAVRRSKIEWVGVRHEEGAALAAAGQAKLTGRLGVCAGTTGPGSTPDYLYDPGDPLGFPGSVVIVTAARAGYPRPCRQDRPSR